MKLDLGAGYKEHDGYLRADIAGKPDVRCDARRLPFRSGAFEKVKAHHILEHIPFGQDRIQTFNEAHRVLGEGGILDVEVPVFPYWTAIADPSHVSFFVTQSFDYFCRGHGHDEHMELYGIAPWEMRARPQRLNDGMILQVEMAKCAS